MRTERCIRNSVRDNPQFKGLSGPMTKVLLKQAEQEIQRISGITAETPDFPTRKKVDRGLH